MSETVAGPQRHRRVFQYVLILLVVMLLLAWALGLFISNCGVRLYLYQNANSDGQGVLWFGDGKVGFTHLAYVYDDVPYHVIYRKQPLRFVDATGMFNIQSHQKGTVVAVPISCVITALLPLAVGAFTRFQFSIRMWFVWSALIAVQCAYYGPLLMRS
jgi:hypothetical protein